ncbi:lactadherin-like [Mya arenaria]|uniref:lactadherin-like n=1 Tax=Mya arenaria TaxID=6604 RepID=UPI0022E6F21F|nr:lactadherin-like [Mya arenaria]
MATGLRLIVWVLFVVRDVYGLDTLCNDKLLKSVPDDHITATSYKSDPTLTGHPPNGRLNTTEVALGNGSVSMGAWAPAGDNNGEHIQVMFDDVTMVNGVFTQGRNQGTDHVTLFKVEYTEDGSTWQTVNDDIGVEKVFGGNSDGDTIESNDFGCPVFAKGIRIVPMGWEKHIALRFDVNGCYLDDSGTATTNTTTPFKPGIVTPFGGTTKAPTALSLLSIFTWGIIYLVSLSSASSTTTRTTVRTTKTTTTPKTTTTTTAYVFHPGILDPFGAVPSLIG